MAIDFTQELFDAFMMMILIGIISRAYFYSPTGCAAALASLELLQTSEMQANIVRVNHSHLDLKSVSKSSASVTTRVLGVILL
jgi:adenosylmethionine-8-amino-7-oxononanoate aminotransferase